MFNPFAFNIFPDGMPWPFKEFTCRIKNTPINMHKAMLEIMHQEFGINGMSMVRLAAIVTIVALISVSAVLTDMICQFL